MNGQATKRTPFRPVAGVVAALSLVIAMFLLAAPSAVVSATFSDPSDPDVWLVSVQLDGLNATDGSAVLWTVGNEAFSVPTGDVLTGVTIVMTAMNDSVARWQDLAASFVLEDPQGQELLNYTLASTSWTKTGSEVAGQFTTNLVVSGLNLMMTDVGVYTVKVVSYYYG